ncbi:MAG: 16S rRNA (guanine(527)-N(7))-methyltransferase RsmG [Vicinamibacterales bacterium]
MATKGLKRRLERRAARAGVEVSDRLIERLCVYVELLLRWNARMNLTALDDRDTGLDRLIVEPLVAVRHLPTRTATVVDIGSGGGSPAIPLKLAAPDVSLLMVEAKTRKAAFLREVVRRLELDRTSVETGRYEALLTRPELHEAHDVLTLRAVRVEARVLRGLQAFIKPGGELLLFRGGGGADVPAELQPPLVWRATYPLVESLRSRLVVLRKLPLGRRVTS